MSLLEVEDLCAGYGPILALRGVALEVEEGEMIALLGANGAGKTTTLRTISGMIAPRGGTVRLAGRALGGLPSHQVVAHGVAHVPEGRELFASMTVEENLRLGHYPRRRDAESDAGAVAAEVMELFPILSERRQQVAGTLSGGEQQMLVVARGLMSRPRLLLVDEMSLGLAPKIVDQLFDILEAVNARGTAVVIVEQFVHLALARTHRAYVLRKGEVVAEGRSADLLADPALVDSYLGDQHVAAGP